MNNEIKIIDPAATDSWDRLLLSNGTCSFFQSSNWAKVLMESYDYTPLYFAVIKRGKLTALTPFMEVNSIVTGKRGVSLPFTDCCEPILDDEERFSEIFAKIVDYGTRAGWKYLEMRPGRSLPGDIKPSSSCYGHVLDIARDEKQIYAGFRDSTRRNIKRAQASNVEVTISATCDSLKAFYRLNCITRKDHGLPPQPYLFFEKIFEHILAKNLGIVVLASYHGETIAGAVYFHFGKNAIYKYGASDKRYQHLRANNLIMWEAIQWYSWHGFHSFHFGRTEPENSGLLQFKRGWGAREYMINYYKYDLRRRTFVTDPLRVSGFHSAVFRKTPIPLLKLAGMILYRHMG